MNKRMQDFLRVHYGDLPIVHFPDGEFAQYVFHVEGLQGYHQQLSKYMTEQTGMETRAYLNFGYFQVHAFQYIAKVKTQSGVIRLVTQRVKDADTHQECVITALESEHDPDCLAKQLIRAHARLQEHYPAVKEYYPIIFKAGECHDPAGGQYIVPMAFTHGKRLQSLPRMKVTELSYPSAWESYQLDYPVRNVLEWDWIPGFRRETYDDA